MSRTNGVTSAIPSVAGRAAYPRQGRFAEHAVTGVARSATTACLHANGTLSSRMADPLALLPFALAAGGGTLDHRDAASLVAAGVTLLQRTAPLVRALDGRHSACLLPPSSAALVALAASVGRGVLVLDPAGHPERIHRDLEAHRVGAVFTLDRYRERVPQSLPMVLLDDAPRSARVYDRPTERVMTVDLGSHHGLALEGSRDAEGLSDLCVQVAPSRGSVLTAWSHRDLLALARRTARTWALTPLDRLLVVLPFTRLTERLAFETATLLMGGRVDHLARFSPQQVADRLVRSEQTVLVGTAALFAALTRHWSRDPMGTRHPALRLALSVEPMPSPGVQRQFAEVTGTPITAMVYGNTTA